MLHDICVFDFETTGLDHANDRVIEMAAMRVIKGEIVSQFQTLVRFDGELAPKITELTGITDEMLVGGMEEKAAFTSLRRMMGPHSLLVAHNAAFDLQFLHYAMQRIGGITFSNPFIDTMTISRERYTYRDKQEGHKLEGMCARLGITLEGAHRAFNDVIGCWELLKALHAAEPVDKWINMLGYLKRYGPEKWYPAHAEPFGTDLQFEPRRAI